jgi:dTDP-glucose 4,6-dehydratase
MKRKIASRRGSISRKRGRVLITGGAGFLGSHLCDHFLDRGFEVLCVDNLVTGSTDNIAHIRSRAFTFIHLDVTGYIYVEGPVDYILHFASPASPKDYLDLPIQTLKVGSLGTHKALGLAKAKKAVFLLASTSEVYGDPRVHPQKESYWGNVNPVGPRGVYDEAKRFAEALTVAYRNTHGVNTKIARIFNTYGPRMRLNDGRAIPAFMSQALRGEPVTVFGDGSQTRSFCYIDDLVEGIDRLLMSKHTGPMNLGNPRELSLLDMARRIIKLTGSRSRIVFRRLPTDDPKVRQPDIALARRALGWSPAVSLDRGLRNTVEYFRERVGRPRR